LFVGLPEPWSISAPANPINSPRRTPVNAAVKQTIPRSPDTANSRLISSGEKARRFLF